MSRRTQDTTRIIIAFDYRGLTFCARPFHAVCLTITSSYRGPITPPLRRFGLVPFRSPLLGESLVYFLFLQLLRCFNSLGFSNQPNCSVDHDTALPVPDFSIRIPSDLCVLATPRSVSPLSASFLSRQCQGIHRTPFYA